MITRVSGILLLDLGQQLNAVHAGHLDIHEKQIKRGLSETFQGLVSGGGRGYLMAAFLKRNNKKIRG